MKRIVFLFVFLVLLSIAAVGCKPDNAATNAGTKPPSSSSKNFLEMTDAAKRHVVIEKKPERVVIMASSILNYAAAVNGKIVGRPSEKIAEIPDMYHNTEEVGHVFNINMEKVVGLKPDLVLMNAQQNNKISKMLESNHIPFIVLQPKTYEEIKQAMVTVGKVYGNEAVAVKKNKEMDDEIARIISKLPEKRGKKIVILHATPSTVTVELENSIAGGIAKMLGFVNIASGSTPIQGKPERTPYSMEVLVEKNPDIIFITSMGAKDKIEKRLQSDVQGNPAYAALTAVKNHKVYVLPEEMFLLTPGLRYPEAVQLMAKDVFPESFK